MSPAKIALRSVIEWTAALFSLHNFSNPATGVLGLLGAGWCYSHGPEVSDQLGLVDEEPPLAALIRWQPPLSDLGSEPARR